MAKWQKLGPGGSPGTSRGAVSQWDNNSIPSPTLISPNVWAEVLLKSLLKSASSFSSAQQYWCSLQAAALHPVVPGEPTAPTGHKDGKVDIGEVMGQGSHHNDVPTSGAWCLVTAASEHITLGVFTPVVPL